MRKLVRWKKVKENREVLREKITPLFMLCAKCNMFCTQDLVGIKQVLKFGAPAIGSYLKEVQKCKISLVHI